MSHDNEGKRPGSNHHLFKLFVVALALSLTGVGVAAFWVVSTALERNMGERARAQLAGIVKEEICKEIGDVDLSLPLEGEALEKVAAKARHFNFSPGVVHVKIWNREKTVVWSERRELLGRKSPDNEELAEALETGRVVSEVNLGSKYDWEPALPERILEVYIPIRFSADGSVLAVAEIYQDIAPLDEDIAHHRSILLAVITASFGALFLVLSGIVWRGSRKIDEQARQLRRSVDEISEARDEWASTFDTISDAITVHDRDFNIVRANREAKKLLGMDGREGLKCFQYYHDSDVPPDRCPSQQVLGDGSAVKATSHEPHLGRHLEISTFPRRGAAGEIVGLVHVVRDVTEAMRLAAEREKLELQLMQAQKLEAVGRMAGGIAHDFNNLLGIVISCSELLREQIPAADPGRYYLETIAVAVEKGRGMTRQLLAFSRQQVLTLGRIDLNEVVAQLATLLGQAVGSGSALDVRTSPSACCVMADRVQIEQVLLNLVVNARDAMPAGGRVLVETGHQNLNSVALAGLNGSGREGRFVTLAVTDTGTGIPAEIREHIFEPFFSTKAQGKGTGLGLATVFGIVNQHQGFIALSSELGRGSTFEVFLPAVAGDDND